MPLDYRCAQTKAVIAKESGGESVLAGSPLPSAESEPPGNLDSSRKIGRSIETSTGPSSPRRSKRS
jgi:hypothetical protein